MTPTPEALVAEADGHLAAGRWAQAETALRAARAGVAGAELAAAVDFGLARALHEQGRHDESIAVFAAHCAEREPPCEPQFDAIYADGLRATRTFPFPAQRRLRFFGLVERLDATLPLAGEVAECGCFRGLSAYVLCRYLKLWDEDFDGAGFRVFDSFQGLSAPGAEDRAGAGDAVEPMRHAGAFAATLEDVRAALAAFPRIDFRPGWIPASFAACPEARYRFVHVDVDLHAPTLACFEYFFPRLVPGGAIVCDDYNWPGARHAIDAFCAAHGLRAETDAHHQAWITAR